MNHRKPNPLLQLLERNWQDHVQHIPDGLPRNPTRPLASDDRRAARALADANPSDPFVYARTLKDLSRDFVDRQEVEAEARRLRGVAA